LRNRNVRADGAPSLTTSRPRVGRVVCDHRRLQSRAAAARCAL